MIINLAKQLHLKVVAEGIQTEAHTSILQDLACEYGQGFLFSRPVDALMGTALISTQKSLFG